MKSYVDLTIGFARTGVTGYGGGPSTIPLIEYEAVKKYGWMTEEEFGQTLALANTLPGPIATKMAAYIGYKVNGGLGAAVAILAHILPSLFGMLFMLGLLYKFRTSPIVSGMVQGVTPIIGVMLLEMAYKFADKARKGLGMPIAAGLGGASLVLIQFLHLHPGIMIGACLLGAFIVALYKKRAEDAAHQHVEPRKEKSV
ncbi:chromate transporter [Bacillus haikouensis]|jgi:chromate transporter|uniref:chromate transporter n=1 Tax=Bacillus haikouensis TaxID=1510468 RepID=UPI0015563EC5|nr:chromate transporter [Bacillus haikouensis]NQD65735.1 chromate transporter [Bacillus haikouensis]